MMLRRAYSSVVQPGVRVRKSRAVISSSRLGSQTISSTKSFMEGVAVVGHRRLDHRRSVRVAVRAGDADAIGLAGQQLVRGEVVLQPLDQHGGDAIEVVGVAPDVVALQHGDDLVGARLEAVPRVRAGAREVHRPAESNPEARSAEGSFITRTQRFAQDWTVGSFGASVPLFSFGLTVERTTMNLFSTSNQNGAPRQTANAVRSQPKMVRPPAPLMLRTQHSCQQRSAIFSLRWSHFGHDGQPSGRPSVPSSLLAVENCCVTSLVAGGCCFA